MSCGTISPASPGSVRLGAQQYRINVPSGATKLNIRVAGKHRLRFYIRYRTPVTIQDGSLVADRCRGRGPRSRVR